MGSKRSIPRKEKVGLSAIWSMEKIRLMNVNEWNECISGETGHGEKSREHEDLRVFGFN